MPSAKFKISLNKCKQYGYYGTDSTFKDLETNIKKVCPYPIGYVELLDKGNIDNYRAHIKQTKAYSKTSIEIEFNVPSEIFNKYDLSNNKDRTGREAFQIKYIFPNR